MKSLSPKQIDGRARAYRKLYARLEPVEKTIAREKSELIALCRSFGHSPLNAEKTLRLEGVEFNIDASFGQSASVNEDTVEALRRQIFRVAANARQARRIFRALFDERITHVVAPTAVDTLNGLPAGSGARSLRDLFAKVQVVTPRAPSLNVKPRTIAVDGRRSMAAAKKRSGK